MTTYKITIRPIGSKRVFWYYYSCHTPELTNEELKYWLANKVAEQRNDDNFKLLEIRKA